MNYKKQKTITAVIILTIFSLILPVYYTAAADITVENMISLTNQSRKENGLPELRINAQLNQAASAKAQDMLTYQYFDHVSPTGVTPWFWFESVNYDYMYAAENLAIDFKTAEGAHKALMNSLGHRANILNANYKEIGVAVVTGILHNKPTIIIVEEFGSTTQEILGTQADSFTQLSEKSEQPNKPVNTPNTETEIINNNIIPVLQIPHIISNEPISTDNNNQPMSLPTNKKQPHPQQLIISQVLTANNQMELKKIYKKNLQWQKTNEQTITEQQLRWYNKINNLLTAIKLNLLQRMA